MYLSYCWNVFNAFIDLNMIHWSSFAQHAPMLLAKMKHKPILFTLFGFYGSFSQAGVSDYEIHWFYWHVDITHTLDQVS